MEHRRYGLFLICFSLGLSLMLLSRASRPRVAIAAPHWPPTSADVAQDSPTPKPPVRRRRPSAPLSMRVDRTGMVTRPNQTETVANQPPTRLQSNERLVKPLSVVSGRPDGASDQLSETLTPDESADLPPAGEFVPPIPPDAFTLVTDAGPDRVVWAGGDRVELSSSSADAVVAHEWKQRRGEPLTLRGDGNRVLVTGLARQAPTWRDTQYELELVVRDAEGREAIDRVSLYARWAPDLNLTAVPEDRPDCRRYFEALDGVQLPHYECWVRPTNYPAMFAIDSASRLTFQGVTAAAYDFVYSESATRHLYEIQVYQNAEEPVSRLVLLVQTDEQIPAVVTIGVEW